MINYYIFIPFYNKIISITYGIIITSYFLVWFNLLIAKLLESTIYKGQSIVIIIWIILIIFFVKVLRKKII